MTALSKHSWTSGKFHFTPPFRAKREGSISLRRPIKIKKLKIRIFFYSGSWPSLLTETTHTDTSWAGDAEHLWASSHLSRCHPSSPVSWLRVMMEKKSSFKGLQNQLIPALQHNGLGLYRIRALLVLISCCAIRWGARCCPGFTRRVPYLIGEEQNSGYW